MQVFLYKSKSKFLTVMYYPLEEIAIHEYAHHMLCPRVHFKILIFDFESAYIGTANLTGAEIGMKSSNRRNFEAGILTNVSTLVEAASEQFDGVWRGGYCTQCGRKQYCSNPINK